MRANCVFAHLFQVQIPLENQIAAPGEGFHVLTDCLKDEAKLAGTVQIIGIELFKIRTLYSLHST